MVEGSGVKVEMPDEAESSVVLRVLLVEDDPFQQMALSGIIARVEAENAQLTVQLKIAGTGDEALAALEAVESHLVLLDYKLPGGDADTLLPGIRERVGPLGAIVVLSAAEREAPMQRCWLDLGADSYRVKPVPAGTVAELFTYALQKRRYMRKRRRGSGAAGSDADDEAEAGSGVMRAKRPSGGELAPAQAPGILSLLAQGRGGPIHLSLGEDQQTPIAMKVRAAASVRGPPPPPHPHVNRVLNQMAKGESCIETRELCEAGELFDALLATEGGRLPAPRALGWFAQLASAVAHCHKHGAVHGQLHPENVLLAAADCLQVVGFSVCAPVEGVSRVVELREYRPELQAPELEGKRWCAVDELFACDVWALGVLLCCLLTGSYSAEAVAAECDEAEQSAIDAVGALDLGSSGGGGALDVGATPSTASFFGEGPASPAERARPRDAFALVKLMLAPDPAARPSAEQIVEDVAALLRSS